MSSCREKEASKAFHKASPFIDTPPRHTQFCRLDSRQGGQLREDQAESEQQQGKESTRGAKENEDHRRHRQHTRGRGCSRGRCARRPPISPQGGDPRRRGQSPFPRRQGMSGARAGARTPQGPGKWSNRPKLCNTTMPRIPTEPAPPVLYRGRKQAEALVPAAPTLAQPRRVVGCHPASGPGEGVTHILSIPGRLNLDQREQPWPMQPHG